MTEEYIDKDYYGILGIHPDADITVIRGAYRRLALEYHPDRNQDDPAATAKMREINEAYAVLSDPAKRQEYDEMREEDGQYASEHYRRTHTTEDIYRGSDINQVYGDLARQFGLRDFDKIFRETYGSSYRSFQFRNKGVYGQAFVFFGPPKGARGASRHPTRATEADMAKLLQQLAASGKNAKKGKDRKNIINISSGLARQGGEAALSITRRGKMHKFKIKIPAGIKDGQQIKLRGMGDAGSGGGAPGDLYLEVKIK